MCQKMLLNYSTPPPPLLVRPSRPGVMRMSQRSEEGNALFLTEVKGTFGCDCSNTRWAGSWILDPLPGSDPPAPHTEPLQCPHWLLKAHIRASIQTVLSSFEVPRMWNNRAWFLKQGGREGGSRPKWVTVWPVMVLEGRAVVCFNELGSHAGRITCLSLWLFKAFQHFSLKVLKSQSAHQGIIQLWQH